MGTISDRDHPEFFLMISNMIIHTWEHLPYIGVLKSVHRTATVCSSIRPFFRGSKLLTVAVPKC